MFHVRSLCWPLISDRAGFSRLGVVPSLRSSLRRRPFVALVLLILLLVAGYAIRAVTDHQQPRPHVAAVALDRLPEPAQQTVALIRRGGPYPSRQDGSVYDDSAHRLPPGSYRQYSVPLPGSQVITGRDGTFYYTGDGGRTFERIQLP